MTAGGLPGGPLLAVDTATTRAVIALGSPDGAVLSMRSWVAGYRHGEELMPQIEALLGNAGVPPASLGGFVVGTGPGAFTGLRVGLATVKGLAYALGLPVIGVSTGEALLAAAAVVVDGDGATHRRAASPLVLLQPAGPSGTVLSRPGQPPRIVAGGEDPGLAAGELLVAVDLEGRVPADVAARGAAALTGLAAELLRAGGERLATGRTEALADIVPEYVTLPRGVRTPVPESAVEVTGRGAEP